MHTIIQNDSRLVALENVAVKLHWLHVRGSEGGRVLSEPVLVHNSVWSGKDGTVLKFSDTMDTENILHDCLLCIGNAVSGVRAERPSFLVPPNELPHAPLRPVPLDDGLDLHLQCLVAENELSSPIFHDSESTSN